MDGQSDDWKPCLLKNHLDKVRASDIVIYVHEGVDLNGRGDLGLYGIWCDTGEWKGREVRNSLDR